jgi:hypothetical protein
VPFSVMEEMPSREAVAALSRAMTKAVARQD